MAVVRKPPGAWEMNFMTLIAGLLTPMVGRKGATILKLEFEVAFQPLGIAPPTVKHAPLAWLVRSRCRQCKLT